MSLLLALISGGGTETTLTPAKGSLSLTGKQPTVTQSVTVTLTPTTGHLATSGKTPTLTQPNSLAPSEASATLSGKAPTLTQPNSVIPVNGAPRITGYQPTVSQSASTVISPIAGHALVTGKQVTLSQPNSLAPTKSTVTLTGKTPTVVQSGASDPRLDQILALLQGRKVYDKTTGLWRVYDAGGTELADPSGVLWRGLHGWMLQSNANEFGADDYIIRARRRGRR